jgi:hypothetical protein
LEAFRAANTRTVRPPALLPLTERGSIVFVHGRRVLALPEELAASAVLPDDKGQP